jgi:uroporphyrinogen decarboxylase
MSLSEYFSNGDYVAEGQIRMLKKYGYDNVWSLFYVGKEAEILGCQKIIFAEDGPPNVEDFVIKTNSDICRLQIPDDIAGHPAFAEQLKCLKILKREVGGKNPVCAYISSSMTIPAMLMGMEKWMELLFLGPHTVRDELLAKCHDFFIREITAYRNAGADTLIYSNPFGSTDTVPMKFFMEHSLPWIEKDISAVGTDGIVYYCGMSRFNRVINIVMERTGIGVYYLSPLDDVAEGKKIIAGRGLTCGVINDIKLLDWTEEEIRSEVKRIIDAGMPGGKFAFGTGVMPYNVPEKSITTMMEAACEFGNRERYVNK